MRAGGSYQAANLHIFIQEQISIRFTIPVLNYLQHYKKFCCGAAKF